MAANPATIAQRAISTSKEVAVMAGWATVTAAAVMPVTPSSTRLLAPGTRLEAIAITMAGRTLTSANIQKSDESGSRDGSGRANASRPSATATYPRNISRFQWVVRIAIIAGASDRDRDAVVHRRHARRRPRGTLRLFLL